MYDPAGYGQIWQKHIDSWKIQMLQPYYDLGRPHDVNGGIGNINKNRDCKAHRIKERRKIKTEMN
jgi:hypothetical protein